MKCSYKYTERGQLKIYNRIVRSSSGLTCEQRNVLLFILERTIGWQKVWQSISTGEFTNGVFRKISGRRVLVMHGTGLAPDRLSAAIDALREAGAIATETLSSKIVYRVNEDWLHPELQGAGRLAIWGLNEGDYLYENDAGGEQ